MTQVVKMVQALYESLRDEWLIKTCDYVMVHWYLFSWEEDLA